MKATYQGFEAKKSGFSNLPPVGAYVAEIQGIRMDTNYNSDREVIVCMLEIVEGEYAGQYHKVFDDQKSRFGDGVKYKGVFRITPYVEGDDAWVRSRFENALWCVEQSNPGYHWDWDENKLKGKKIGINVRRSVYTGRDGAEKETTEIAQFETVQDVKDGKCKVLRDRIQKSNNTAEPTFTNVSADVEVPF